ncbi:hypothetical protein LIER_14192 [Lithospermum erythrorhizon]|uniref:non-specific serine/threonine protein kinase n=1 Tax=Lithospermum erythrorhizon TaxID=34254 RepID=A0AAV3PY92_LITER
MGLGSDHINVGMRDSKETKKRVVEEEEMRGCLFRFGFHCITPRPKVDGSCNTSNAHDAMESNKSSNNFSKDQPVFNLGSSSSSSIVESSTSTPNITGELKVASQLRKFTSSELKSATRNFRPENILGEGGFGCVHKGWVNDSGSVLTKSDQAVAVKTLNHDGLQGHREWLAEVYFLGDLLHPNLVKLIGYCMEDDQRMLVYEFMPRGSLDNHLFRRALPLPWKLRMKIALGAAKGLAFLHEEAERPVIYRDFKSSNVLLDTDYNVKLSDFGLAKDGPEGDKTHVSTRVMGTYGYAAPEYLMTGHLTSRSDVYSFGVVLLEMLSGRKSMDKNKPQGQQNLLEWAKPYLADKHRYFRLIDQRLQGQFSIRGAKKAIQVAARCLNSNPKTRPLMSEVVEALKTLQDLTDIASSSTYSEAMQTERSNNIKRRARNVAKQQGGSAFRNSHLTPWFPIDV